MPPEVMFVAITGIVCTFMVIRMGIKHSERRLQLMSGGEEGGRLEQILVETQKEVARLRDRVQVLEKLVTDDDRNLAAEIERLRRSETGANR